MESSVVNLTVDFELSDIEHQLLERAGRPLLRWPTPSSSRRAARCCDTRISEIAPRVHRAVRGAYHDALHVKRNTVVLFLLSTLGGLAPGAVRHLHDLSRRGLDTR